MGSTSFSLSTTVKRLQEIERINPYNCKSDFINKAVDIHIKSLKTRYLSDLFYYIALPFLSFMGFIGITLYLADMFFTILTCIVGIYLIILVFLFYDKYKKVKKNG